MVKHKVIDNFLNQSDFTELTNNLLPSSNPNDLNNPGLSWTYEGKIVSGGDQDLRFKNATNIELANPIHQWCFAHPFFTVGYESYAMGFLTALLNKIKPIALCRIQATFTPQQEKRRRSYFHLDMGQPHNHTQMITAIFYLNTTNAPTILEDGTEIECRANRFVSYPANTYHAGVLCTDQPYRVLINLNYFKDIEWE